jgi:hypothetical protein
MTMNGWIYPRVGKVANDNGRMIYPRVGKVANDNERMDLS